MHVCRTNMMPKPLCSLRAAGSGLALLCLLALGPTHSFVFPTTTRPWSSKTCSPRQGVSPRQRPQQPPLRTAKGDVLEVGTAVAEEASAKDESDSANDNSSTDDFEFDAAALKGAEGIEFKLTEHKPLGCAVEESLANEPDRAVHVFVSQVKEGGNAEEAGIQPGDVIVQLSGTFNEVVDVTGLGIEKIKSLVGGRPAQSPLVVRVARGTDVMERHEIALVDLCIIGDVEVEGCIDAIYRSAAAAENANYLAVGEEEIMPCEDDGTECLLDSMWDTWSDGLEPSSANTNGDDGADSGEEKKKKPKVAPWSSRSSGSGTWVRDPKTGKLRNIDEE